VVGRQLAAQQLVALLRLGDFDQSAASQHCNTYNLARSTKLGRLQFEEAKMPEIAKSRILVLAHDFMLATAIADLLEDDGYDVAGPALSILESKRIIEIDGVDGAVIDADMEGAHVLARQIAQQGGPVLLVANILPQVASADRRTVSRLTKHFIHQQLLDRISRLFARQIIQEVG
jgi:hypothetical protein